MSYFDIYKGYIYCHISPSGKKYIGKTERPLNSRWANGKGYSSCTVFKKAIDKYGWENFEHLVLEEIKAKTKEELQKILSNKERDYILKYNTLVPNGYNLTIGGEGVTKICISEDDLKKYYIDLDYSPEKIALLFNTNGNLIRSLLKQAGIWREKKHVVSLPKKELEQLYLIEKKGIYEIAKIKNCRSEVIKNRLEEYQIPIRTRSEVQKSKISYEELYQWYVEQKLSVPKIASLAKCSKSTVYNTIDRYCLNRREYGK